MAYASLEHAAVQRRETIEIVMKKRGQSNTKEFYKF